MIEKQTNFHPRTQLRPGICTHTVGAISVCLALFAAFRGDPLSPRPVATAKSRWRSTWI